MVADVVNHENDNFIINIKTVQSGAFRILIEALKEILTDTNLEFDCPYTSLAKINAPIFSEKDIPFTLKKINIDPAIASSVFVTTITNVIGFVSFLGVGAYFL